MAANPRVTVGYRGHWRVTGVSQGGYSGLPWSLEGYRGFTRACHGVTGGYHDEARAIVGPACACHCRNWAARQVAGYVYRLGRHTTLLESAGGQAGNVR